MRQGLKKTVVFFWKTPKGGEGLAQSEISLSEKNDVALDQVETLKMGQILKIRAFKIFFENGAFFKKCFSFKQGTFLKTGDFFENGEFF